MEYQFILVVDVVLKVGNPFFLFWSTGGTIAERIGVGSLSQSAELEEFKRFLLELIVLGRVSNPTYEL